MKEDDLLDVPTSLLLRKMKIIGNVRKMKIIFIRIRCETLILQ